MCLLIKRGTKKEIMLLRGNGSYCIQRNRGHFSSFDVLCSEECNNCKSFILHEHKCAKEEEFLNNYNQTPKTGVVAEGVYA